MLNKKYLDENIYINNNFAHICAKANANMHFYLFMYQYT